MADIRPLTADFAAAPQIAEADYAEIARLGYRMVINNRPEGESSDQHAASKGAALAAAHGLAYRHIPVSGGPTQQAVDAMVTALEEAEGPVLAHCRSGTRSANLWALAEAARGGRAAADLIAAGTKGGYDLSGLAPLLRQLGAK
jgi:sulfide:quinone oxidoreductase